MTLDEGATNEINTRWPEYKQRNCALMGDLYGRQYTDNMTIGIQLVRDHYARLTNEGSTVWSIPTELGLLLDELAGIR
jgi:hypothetical protein